MNILLKLNNYFYYCNDYSDMANALQHDRNEHGIQAYTNY